VEMAKVGGEKGQVLGKEMGGRKRRGDPYSWPDCDGRKLGTRKIEGGNGEEKRKLFEGSSSREAAIKVWRTW